MATFYALHVNSEQLSGSLSVNDVRLSQSQAAGQKPKSAAYAINLWITGTQNRVTIEPEWPKDGEISPKLEMRVLATTQADQPSDQGSEVASFKWASKQRPAEIRFDFQASDPPPSTLWRGLQAISEIDPDTREKVVAVLKELNSALGARNLERSAGILDFKAAEVARCMYMNPDQARASQREFLGMFLEESRFSMTKLEDNEIDLHLVANKRLVWATRADFAPVLQSATQNPQLQLPVYLAPVNGTWTVVR